MDAEIAYRHAQVRAQLGHRRRGWFRRAQPVTRTGSVKRGA